ncbi:saccharopine dehydrogenase family protein [Streptomyces boluensis]|uniref:Saccharopine dehydrogenase n=1 Tax=Streptomyces boluensis TaxID=1775135 RepID=A0A964UJ21_9ACTN|nr:saccharopine dehydrogenase NADP-binding domain-containing protein [Streptomyces boluensis]NBE49999.1 saccharopine dehydrogenase [Streptomyces boluensis]
MSPMSTDKSASPRTAVIVGGAGAMGRWGVRAIARLGSVERLLIADIDIARAKQVAAEVGGPCTAVELDATDTAAMRTLFAECDVVLNTMGPFSLFARPILEAAIDSDCHYLDIDDDWESTVEAFDLHARARERGLTVVKGIGGSPGFSNLSALVAARRLDEVDTLLTGWSMGGAVLEEEPDYPSAGGAGAAVEHWLIQISGTIRAWREGGVRDLAPLQPVEFDYPGLGRVRGFTVGHPEALTLPRHLPGLTTSLNITSGPDWLFDHARSVAADFDAGAINLAEGAQQLENPPRPAERAPRDPLGQVWTVAVGTRNGRRTAVSVQPTAMPPGRMGGGTGVALAVGLELLCRGRIKESGVHSPEAVIDPEDFFPLYAEFVEPATAGDDLLLVQEIDDPAPVSLPALTDEA